MMVVVPPAIAERVPVSKLSAVEPLPNNGGSSR